MRFLVPCVALCLGLSAPAAGQSGTSGKVTPQELARIWDSEHVSPPLPPLLDHPEVVKRLDKLRETAPELFELEKIGESIEGRSINHVRVGTGSLRVLLWSQMHGDESTATAALFDVFEYLQRHREDPLARRVLSRLTHRRQSRRAAAANPRGARAEGVAGSLQPLGRIQPAQPELADVGRRPAEAGVDFPAVGRV